MKQLSISLLGLPKVALNGEDKPAPRMTQTFCLLAYLLRQDGWSCSRDTLLVEFWPEESERVARHNLRQAVYQLRRMLEKYAGSSQALVSSDRYAVKLNPVNTISVDVDQFLAAYAARDMETAVSLYRGDFLDGFSTSSNPIETWLSHQREKFQRLALNAMAQLNERHLANGDYAQAHQLAHRQLDIEPWHETAHRQLMTALALGGDRNAALAQFDLCYEALERELGVEPSDKTVALYEQIATNTLKPSAVDTTLPLSSTPFVGRTSEMLNLIQIIEHPTCRLLTLVGAAGIGKTRLAVEFAQRFQVQTGHAVCFVSLLDASNAEAARQHLDHALMSSVEQPKKPDGPIRLLLIDHVTQRIMDSDDFAPFLADLMAKQPTLKILLTARRPLNTRSEWVMLLNGLTWPQMDTVPSPQQWQQYDALVLFQQRALQANTAFALHEQNMPHVCTICAMLEGNAVGIELAAAQTRHHTTEEIVSLLPDLAVELSNFPNRHRSFSALFEDFFASLSEPERRLLCETAVFHGGFSRAAAAAVLKTDISALEPLINYSLLRRYFLPHGVQIVRYGMMPTMARYLRKKHGVSAPCRERHAVYYLNWAVTHPDSVELEQENVAAAYEWAKQRPSLLPKKWRDSLLAQQSQPRAIPQPEQKAEPILHIGRAKELMQLRLAVSRLIETQKNQGAVVVLGEAGIGKSHLVQQVKASLRTFDSSKSYLWLESHCDEGDTQTYKPFRTLLRDYFNMQQNQPKEARQTAFSARFDDLYQTIQDKELRAQLRQGRSFLAALVDIIEPNSPYARAKPERRRDGFAQAIKCLIQAESALQPVVLHIDDAHWMDQASRDLLDQLIRYGRRYPYLILLMARPDGFESPKEVEQVEAIRLAPLTKAAVAEMATRIHDSKPSNELINFLHTVGAGNPFYTRQLLLYLIDHRLIKKGAFPPATRPSVDTPLPHELHNLLVARLGHLDNSTREVVEQAAVIGFEFSVDTLEKIVGVEETKRVLEIGSRKQLWQPTQRGHYIFAHALLHKAATANQFNANQRRYHHQVAKVLLRDNENSARRSSRLAHHLDKANRGDKATQYYFEAGLEAHKNYFVHEAHQYYSRGLELARTSAQKLKFYLQREQINHWLGNREEQRNDLRWIERLTDNSKDTGLLVDLNLRQGHLALSTGQYTTAIHHAQRAMSLAVAVDDRLLEAKAYHQWGRAVWQQGDPNSATPLLKRALRTAEQAKATALQALCLYDLSILDYYKNAFSAASDKLETAVSLFLQMEDQRGVIRCKNMLGLIETAKGDFQTALAYQAAALKLCRSIDWPYGTSRMLLHLGNCYFELGEFEQCRELHHEALAISKMIGDHEAEVLCLDSIGLCHQSEFDYKEAKRYFSEALSIAEATENLRFQAFLKTHLGALHTDTEAIEEAIKFLYEAQSLRNKVNDEQGKIDTDAALAWLDLARGDLVYAAERAREVIFWLEQHGPAGVESPLLVYWKCFYILDASGNLDEANEVLDHAHTLLQQRLQRIEDMTQRHAFINRIDHHKKIEKTWRSRRS